MKPQPLCDLCGNQHPIHDDGFEYLDCMLDKKKRDGKMESNHSSKGTVFPSESVLINPRSLDLCPVMI